MRHAGTSNLWPVLTGECFIKVRTVRSRIFRWRSELRIGCFHRTLRHDARGHEPLASGPESRMPEDRAGARAARQQKLHDIENGRSISARPPSRRQKSRTIGDSGRETKKKPPIRRIAVRSKNSSPTLFGANVSPATSNNCGARERETGRTRSASEGHLLAGVKTVHRNMSSRRRRRRRRPSIAEERCRRAGPAETAA